MLSENCTLKPTLKYSFLKVLLFHINAFCTTIRATKSRLGFAMAFLTAVLQGRQSLSPVIVSRKPHDFTVFAVHLDIFGLALFYLNFLMIVQFFHMTFLQE